MALLNAESFSIYGTSLAQLSLRGYASPGSLLWNISPTGGRTNGFIEGNTSSQTNQGFSWILSPEVNVAGSGIAISVLSTPTANVNRNHGLAFGIGADGFTYKINVNPSLGISVFAGSTLIGSSAPALIVTNSYYWLEARITNNAFGGGLNTGTIEVRLNGVTVVTISGINITAQFSRISIGATQVNEGLGPTASTRFCDWVMWDGSGTINNSFLGDRRCSVSFPNTDTALEQWTPNTGVDSWAILDNNPANDAQFVEATAVGNISEFGTTPIPINSNDVAGIVILGRAAKLDAGTATFRLGINSAGNVINSAPIAPNVAPSFNIFGYVVERNPNGNIPWTRTAADAALPRITREA